jgi:ribosomal protein L12E/L44/L45/RPP1/RPP2
MRWLALLVMALALVAAGCGGSDNESAGSNQTTTEETTSTESTTEETTTEESTDTGDLSGVLDDEDCLRLAGIGATFAQAITGATDEEAAEAFQNLVDNVPDEIKADVQVLADWFADYSAKVKDIGIEAGQTPTAEQIQQLSAALADTNQDEVTAASQRIGTWANENCSAAGG